MATRILQDTEINKQKKIERKLSIINLKIQEVLESPNLYFDGRICGMLFLLAIVIARLIMWFLVVTSNSRSCNISRKLRALIDKFTNLTSLKFFCCSLIKVLYLSCFLWELFLQFDLKPTVNSSI